jgi:phosphoribosylanthranilate isomerase
MFQIKICGITRLKDGLAAAAAGADAIGFNFCRNSPRYIEPSAARTIGGKLPALLLRVGVVVDASPDEIWQTTEEASLGAVQLHGDEPPTILAALPLDVLLLRAFRMREAGLAPLAEYIDAAAASGRSPDAVLIDAFSHHAHGGTGQIVDWQRVREERSMLGDIPLILAGGLTPHNVADAIGMARPEGVDTASGVEISAGIKDPVLIRGFVDAAREALA